jgi:hypothetical protein
MVPILPRRGVWPVAEHSLPLRKEWVREDEAQSVAYESCRSPEEAGSEIVDPAAWSVQNRHHELCRAESMLPMAWNQAGLWGQVVRSQSVGLSLLKKASFPKPHRPYPIPYFFSWEPLCRLTAAKRQLQFSEWLLQRQAAKPFKNSKLFSMRIMKSLKWIK